MSFVGGPLRLKRSRTEKQDKPTAKKLKESIEPSKTPAEIAFQNVKKRNAKDRITEKLKLSHKDRIERYNKQLSELAEHFDIPKVGPS
jgi:hypothetical protein